MSEYGRTSFFLGKKKSLTAKQQGNTKRFSDPRTALFPANCNAAATE